MPRRKGDIGMLNRTVKEAVERAFRKVNRDGDYLVKLADSDPKTFCALVSKCIPSAVAVSVSHHIDLSDAMLAADANIKRLEKEYEQKALRLSSNSKTPVIENDVSD